MNEVWKDVVGYEGVFLVSNMGNVKRVTSNGNLTPCPDTKGYLMVCLCVGGKKKQKIRKVHRLVAIAFLANPENKPEVNHINGIKQDNRLRNLEWVTSRENKAHAMKTGLCNFENTTGEKSKQSKLTEKAVREIREIRANNKTMYRDLAKIYGVSISTIHHVVTLKSWNSSDLTIIGKGGGNE